MQLANTVYPEFRNGSMKWLASEVLGAGPYPQIGNVWYVDAVAGSDTANNGTAPDSAFATLYAAHNAASSNNYDVIVVAPSGVSTGSGTNESVYGRWTFSKNLITVIGSSAATAISPRSRILWNTALQSTSSNPLLLSLVQETPSSTSSLVHSWITTCSCRSQVLVTTLVEFTSLELVTIPPVTIPQHVPSSFQEQENVAS